MRQRRDLAVVVTYGPRDPSPPHPYGFIDLDDDGSVMIPENAFVITVHKSRGVVGHNLLWDTDGRLWR